MLDRFRTRARSLKTEILAIYLAARDPRTPWYVRALVFFVVAHTLSPIDLIPDFIPVLGYLDDLLITPAGIWLAVRLIPPEVLADARTKAAIQGMDKKLGAAGAIVIVLVWVVIFAGAMYLILSR